VCVCVVALQIVCHLVHEDFRHVDYYNPGLSRGFSDQFFISLCMFDDGTDIFSVVLSSPLILLIYCLLWFSFGFSLSLSLSLSFFIYASILLFGLSSNLLGGLILSPKLLFM